jgi:hypothetical protein
VAAAITAPTIRTFRQLNLPHLSAAGIHRPASRRGILLDVENTLFGLNPIFLGWVAAVAVMALIDWLSSK